MFLKIVGYSLLTILISFIFLIYSVFNGVPFIEGDEQVTDGTAHHFAIGSTKSEVFADVKKNYSESGYLLRVLWPKDSEINLKLESFQNTKWKDYPGRRYSEYKVPITEIEELTAPLLLTTRWDIEIPSNWVNSIYLQFENDRLIQIRKSRWLFERP
ncbi:hypothetical protein [Thalassotalea profundi]|nr:hypothetical protein [Thalassotalea profundi]